MNVAKSLVATRFERRRFASRGARHFASDARYDLQCVTEGFSAHIENSIGDDTALLERICTAYIRAAKQEQIAPTAYKATGWWEQQRHGSLGSVTRALMTRDIGALRSMYGNFYRDPCSAGLISLQSLSKYYFGETIKDIYRRSYLADALYRLDYWKKETRGCFTLRDLSGPAIGNPFGVMVEGTLIRAGADYQHYCAYRISGLLGPGAATVAEIGGGFGGMAYYLLRDRAQTTYINFDVPESIALMSYYLLKAFPTLNFLLYGEDDLTPEAAARADVILMPVFELAKMAEGDVDVVFSSHAMSDLSEGALEEYLGKISRMSRNYFMYVGNGSSGDAMSDLIRRRHPALSLAETQASGWNSHRALNAREIECIYRIGAG